MKKASKKERLQAVNGKTYYDLTVQALHMRNEVFRGGGMDRDTFTQTYLGGIGKYEKEVAKIEGIEIDE